MINLNELRIDNWISDPKRGYCQVNGIQVHSSGETYLWLVNAGMQFQHRVNINEISPILLTPEILEKCGFKKVEHPTSVTIEGDLISGYDHYEDETNYCLPFMNGEILNGHNPIKHLHILQNWYFFCTGQEIPIIL